ncbi:MAG: T9SS type A sorting domain-containing protein [Ignavibacteriaceae bacterium]|nr:T9SS type A sorting domain-containing protein [Ignavibacteriaceae bacterium]
MKKWVVLIIACLFTNILSQTNISPQFSELKGMEDQLGNTHLFYRIYSLNENFPIYFYTYNDVYHLDLNSFSDSLFLRDYIESNPVMFNSIQVKDYGFWNNQTDKFIYCGVIGGQDPVPFINRFDMENNLLNYFCCEVNQIDISSFDDSLIYAGGYLYNVPQSNSIRSHDGGFTWETVNDTLVFLSLNPFDDNLMFCENLNGDIYRSLDAANSFHLVDVMNESGSSDSFLYDNNQLHMYRIYTDRTFRVSPNKGEAFSWQTKYSSDSKIFISNDESVSGTIYLADKKNIFVSTDYGNNFSLYKTFDRKIVGIYKKPNSNKLYAATKYKIYEITPDTIQIIKSLPIPDEVLNFYPLVVGNKWIYNEVTYVQEPNPNVYFRILVKEVLGDTIAPNGKQYYKVNDETIWESSILERVDSTDGMVYRYYEDPSLPESEYVAYDLLAEVGDTISSYRMGFNTVMFTTMYAQGIFEKWGMTKPKKVFEEYTLHPPVFSLTQDVGLDSIYFYFDFGNTTISLKGCVINGVVYGDTTTVGVDDEKNPIATSFRLEQNYPNPFNPTTNIGFRIADFGFVTLKVYDVLGNEIATLVNEEKPAGEYEVEFSPASPKGAGSIKNPASGIYFYQLRAGDFIQTKKMLMIK